MTSRRGFTHTCSVCGQKPLPQHSLCRQCLESLDAQMKMSNTNHAIIHWAAQRAISCLIAREQTRLLENVYPPAKPVPVL